MKPGGISPGTSKIPDGEKNDQLDFGFFQQPASEIRQMARELEGQIAVEQAACRPAIVARYAPACGRGRAGGRCDRLET
jgi:hypothetical protein